MKASVLFILLPFVAAAQGLDWHRAFERAHHLHIQRDYTRAAAQFGQILTELEASDSPEALKLSPRVLNSLGAIHQDLGQFEEAERSYRRALNLQLQRHEEHSPFSIHVLANLGNLYVETRQIGRVRDTCKEAADLLATLDTPTGEAGRLHHLIAMQARIEGDDELARLHLKQALGIWRSLSGFESAVADALNTLGTVSFEHDRFAEARDHFLDAMQQYDKSPNTQETNRAATLTNLACVYLHLRQLDDSRRAYEEALRLLERTVGLQHRYSAQTMLAYALTLEKCGKKREGRQQRRRAEALLAKEASDPAKHVIDVIELAGQQ